MIKAIVFDCFGVLVGTGIWNVYERAGGDKIGDAAFLDEVFNRANLGHATKQETNQAVATKLGISPEQWEKLVDEDESPNRQIFDYIRTVLKPKYKIAMLSNASAGMPKRKFTEEQLELFDAMVVSAEVGLIKPDPEIFKLIAEKLGVEPQECLFVDDHAKYLEGARQIGMQVHHYATLDGLKQEIDNL